MSYSSLEIEFIKEELYQHADYLIDLFEDSIQRKSLIKSGNLLSTFQQGDAYTVRKSGDTVILSIKFPSYGRFIEIQKHKNKIKTESSAGNASKWNKKKKRKDTGWYTRNVYGSLNKLIGNLMYGYSEEVKKQIKKRMEFDG